MPAIPDQAGRAGEEPAPWQVTGQAFRAAVESGRLDLPLPGSGRTRERWAAFADLAGEDLSVARLAEGHADAVAILAELGGPDPPQGSRWGVWAAHPPGPKLDAYHEGGGWRLRGMKRYCSGARCCTHALVTAAAPDGMRLFAVTAAALAPVLGSWPATGMAGSDTLDVDFGDVPAQPVGIPGAYVERPGFAHGGAGVAACPCTARLRLAAGHARRTGGGGLRRPPGGIRLTGSPGRVSPRPPGRPGGRRPGHRASRPVRDHQRHAWPPATHLPAAQPSRAP